MAYWIATREVAAIVRALEEYKFDCGEYPNVRDGLTALVVDNGIDGWQGPYLDKAPVDPWGRPYSYFFSKQRPEIASYGVDGQPGGTSFNADISSESLNFAMPESAYERRIRLRFTRCWLAAWLALIGSALVLKGTAQTGRAAGQGSLQFSRPSD
ncbi:MAG TPA: type II secretion system protein GspG [Bryobacteraceae bacterium]|nr:type II secretion system protein GspG [Bryobacteraceae bacterium]